MNDVDPIGEQTSRARNPSLRTATAVRLISLFKPVALPLGMYLGFCVYVMFSRALKFQYIPRLEQICTVTALFVLWLSIIILFKVRRVTTAADQAIDRSQLVILSTLVFGNAFATSSQALLESMGPEQFTLLSLYLAAIAILQAFAIFAFVRNVRSKLLVSIGLAITSTCAIYGLYLVLSDVFVSFSRETKTVILAAVLFSLTAALFAALKLGFNLRLACVVLGVTLLPPAVAGLLAQKTPAGAFANGKDAGALANITLSRRPDIHIVSFESLQPPTLLKQNMGIATVPFSDFLRRKNVKVFSNVFSSHPSTHLSLNGLMNLDQASAIASQDYFAGRRDSVLAHLFHNNGYRVVTGYGNSYFGVKGPYVDQFHPMKANVASSIVCQFKPNTPLKLFGFCDVGAYYDKEFGESKRWESGFVDIFRSLQSADRPVLSIHHMFVAGHTGHIIGHYVTGNASQYNRFVSVYRDKLGDVAKVLDDVAAAVDGSSRKSVVIVMGDHGAWLSRTAVDAKSTFAVQDRYGILGAAMFTDVSCPEKSISAYSRPYATPARILAGVVRCLAARPADVDAHVIFREDHDMSKYLYE